MDWLFTIVLHNTVVVAFLAFLVWGITRIWNNPPAAHLLWLLVLLKLVTPPLVNLELGNWSTVRDFQVPSSPVTQPLAADSHLPVLESQSIDPNSTEQDMSSIERSRLVAVEVPQALLVQPRSAFAELWTAIRPALFWFWLGGAVLVSLLAAIRIVRFERMLAGTLPASQRIQSITEDLTKRMGLARAPKVRVVESAIAPLIWCLGWRATVVVPLRLVAALDEQKFSMVLAHELAHLRRRDHWVRVLELIVSALCWWNPMVWWVRRRLHTVEEQCCDAWVAWVYPDRCHEYAESLLRAAELLPVPSSIPALASPFLNSHALKERIEMVLKNRSPRTASRLIVIGLTLLAVVVIPAGVRGLEGDEPEKPAPVAGPKEPENPTVSEEIAAFQGAWKFDIYYSDWWPERISNPPLSRSKWRWTIKGYEIQWTGMKVPDVKLSFTVDPSKSPRQIDMTFLDGPHKGKKLLGMYELISENACNICFADPEANIDRPQKVEYSTNSRKTMVSIERVPPEKTAADTPSVKEKNADRGPEIDAAIARLRTQGAMVREFHPRGDPEYWVQIISNNFSDENLGDVEIISRGVPLDFHLNHSSVTPEGLKRLASTGRINQLELSGDNIDDTLVKVLPMLPLHGQLGLHSNSLTDAGIKTVAACQHLESISLDGKQLSNACLENLIGLPKLQRVSLGKNFTRGAFDILSRLEGLTNLDASAVSPELSDLAKFPNLKTLSLSGKQYDDEAARTIAETFTSLESAYLRDTSITNVGVEHLSRLEKLTILTLDDSLVDDGMADSIRKMKQMTWLSLERCSIGDGTVAALSECPEMWYVFLVQTQVTDKGLADLRNLKKPLSLYLAHCKAITDEGIKSLAQLSDSPNLHIALWGSSVTEKGMAELKAALPNAQIR